MRMFYKYANRFIKLSPSILLIAALTMITSFFITPIVHAQQSDVSLDVSQTKIRVAVKTSPYAFTTVQLNGKVISTGTASVTGNIVLLYSNTTAGLHEVTVQSIDSSGRYSTPVTLSVNIAAQETTQIAVFLPPVIALSPDQVQSPQPVRVSGSGFPGSTIIAVVNDQASLTTKVNGGGEWSLLLSTEDLLPGIYSMFAKSLTSFGEQSFASSAQNFSVLSKSAQVPQTTDSGNGTPVTINVEPRQLPQPNKTQSNNSISSIVIRTVFITLGLGLLGAGARGAFHSFRSTYPKSYNRH